MVYIKKIIHVCFYMYYTLQILTCFILLLFCVSLIEQQALASEDRCGRSPSMAMFQEMEARGKTVGDLYGYADSAHLKMVCDLIQEGLTGKHIHGTLCLAHVTIMQHCRHVHVGKLYCPVRSTS